MDKRFLKLTAIGMLSLTGCAGVHKVPSPTPPTPVVQKRIEIPIAVAVSSGPARDMVVFVPLSDAGVEQWIKLWEKNVDFRAVVAISPRFTRFASDSVLRQKILKLETQGRLMLALQLPSPPFLPLIANSDSAKNALPAGAEIPRQRFEYPGDVIQLLAKNRSDFQRQWGRAPQGFVLPFGAASEDLLRLLKKLNINWTVGAMGMTGEGAYQDGGLVLFDAAPFKVTPLWRIRVLDERAYPGGIDSLKMLSSWVEENGKAKTKLYLPSDGIPELPSPQAYGHLQEKTWTEKDWHRWIGNSDKNTAWDELRRTREALERYKNSGRAVMTRLDVAMNEMILAESAGFFSSRGEGVSASSEERAHEFQATLVSIYRQIGEVPPEDLFETPETRSDWGVRFSSVSARWESLADGGVHVYIEDPTGDQRLLISSASSSGMTPTSVPAPYDLKLLEVTASSQTLTWSLEIAGLQGASLGDVGIPGPLIDVYIDLNNQPNVGTSSFLPGRGAQTPPRDAWEYALCFQGTEVLLLRTHGTGNYDSAGKFPLRRVADRVDVVIPRDLMRGNPPRWGYQVLLMAADPRPLSGRRPNILAPLVDGVDPRFPVYDILDPAEITQAQLFSEIEEGKRHDVPFVHVRQ